MAANIVRRLHSTALVAVNLLPQRRIPFLPQERLHQMRDERVRELVRYAADTVPFYQDFFRSQGIDPQEIRTAEDLERLPLIDKQVVRQQPQRFVSTSKFASELQSFLTTGTTGQPLTVLHDRRSVTLDTAFNERHRDVLRRLVGRGTGLRTVSIARSGNTYDQVRAVQRRDRFAWGDQHRITLSISDPVEAAIEVINRHRPELLRGYGSYLELLFRTVQQRHINMHLPQVVSYGVDAISDAGRRLIETGFGVPVLSGYSAVEAFKIGFLCEKRTSFHLHDDLTHVRIVDPTGRTLGAEERGDVVISNLVNHGMVLLNYRLADLGHLSEKRCPCGRSLRLLGGLEGRASDMITLADGTMLNPSLVWAALDFSSLLQFQLIQHEPEVFELRLATADRPTFDSASRSAVAALRALLGPSAEILPVYYADRLPTGPGGKFREVVSHVPRPI